VEVVDVGANPIDEIPPYRPLLAAGRARVTGFEPNRAALAKLEAAAGPAERYLPHVVGDGAPALFHLCRAPGMSSTFRLNEPLMQHFHGFTDWGRVVSEERMDTVRLDDVPEIASIDYLKIDVQGGELKVFEGARAKLSRALWVHTEVMFLEMYQGQPLFADQDNLLRSYGLRLHCFASPMARVLKPMMVNGDIYAGLNQLLQADAVYVRDFTRLDALGEEELLKLALVAHDVYHSFDLANLALLAVDRKESTSLSPRYLSALGAK
jgi:FkbM family methyltransferase